MKFLISLDNLNAINGYVIAPRQLAIALRESGHTAKIFCRIPPKIYMTKEAPEDFLKLTIDPINNQKIFKEFNPDVVIANSNYPTDLMLIDYAHKNNILSLYFVHSRIESLLKTRLFLGEYWPDFVMSSIIKVFKDAIKSVDVIVALNEEMEKYVKGLFPERSIEIIGNGINLDMFKHHERAIDPNERVNLLYVANFEARKNQLYMIKVMENLPNNYILHLVGGPEDPNYHAKFMGALKKYKRGNIVYHGKLGIENLIPLYDEADVFVNSSVMEAQSLVLMEAIASGLPIVRLFGRETEGVTINDLTAVHIDENADPVEFANALESLVNNPESYRKINEAQLKEREKFGRKRASEQLLQVVNKYNKTLV